MALHQDLRDSNYASDEIKAVMDSKEISAILDKEPSFSWEDSEGFEEPIEEDQPDLSEEALSVDAIYYTVDYAKVGKHRRKHKRKDYSDLVPRGGSRNSGHLRSIKQSKLPSFMDLDADSA